MTDSKSVTQMFQTEMIPKPLWKACHFVLQSTFTIAHIAGKMNTEFYSSLESNLNKKFILEI